jgi:TPP-dependent pyruvate/acetoin dehydrogenase alpha subunit
MTIQGQKRPTKSAPQSVQNGFSLISNEKLAQMFVAMLRCRMILERAHGPRNRRSARREAIAAGLVIDLLPEDTVAASTADLSACYLKGLPLDEMLSALAAPRSVVGQPGADPFSAHRVLAPWLSPSARLNMAAGIALANKRSGGCGIAMVFGGAEDAEGAWRETLEFASIHELPMVFVRVCEARPAARTNESRAGSALKAQYSPPVIPPVVPVDRDDAVAVYRVAQETIAHARRGMGPTLIDCVPFQVGGASADWQAADPILNMERYLVRKGLPVARLKEVVVAGFGRELDAALKSAMPR